MEETAYLMFHKQYPPTHQIELIFWKSKETITLDDAAIYEMYRFNQGTLDALAALPYVEILVKLKDLFHWNQHGELADGDVRFTCPNQSEYWGNTHFWVFEYSRESGTERECQLLRFSCHNMSEEQLKRIITCMELFQCPLCIHEERRIR